MTTGRWQRIQRLVEAALEIPPTSRAGFITLSCEDDESLCRQVQELVESDEHAGSFLAGAFQAGARAVLAAPSAGDRIGVYQISSVIGHGGMGVVYRASRADRQFQHEVAIKLIRVALSGTSEALSRFRTERQILANLNHPNICRLLDGGAFEDGSPYFVMEYVPGQPIDRYCAAVQLSIRERLRLFQQVAIAVQYAHQNVIVHRDIKPANVLVTDDGVPKLLDFGIAKMIALDGHLSPATAAADRMMTPQYASPEQIRGEAITTSTDIYSLGALLYHLLAGRPPFALENASFGQMEREICTRIPEKPSDVAQSRELQGDLDRIILKALHKEPARRYVSAADFSADIGRYLDGFPVGARPDSWSYRAGKFIGRHRIGTAAVILFTLALLGFGVSMAVLRNRAEREARTAAQVTEFLVNLFESNDPAAAKGENVTARELLDRAAVRIETQLKSDPAVQARLFDTVGSLYDDLGVWPQAESLIKKALDLREHKLPRDDLAIASTLQELGGISFDLDHFDEGERSYRESLRLYQLKLGPANAKVAGLLDDLGTIVTSKGNLTEGEKLVRQSLELNTRLLGPKDTESTRALNNLVHLLRSRGDYAEAEPMNEQLIRFSIESGGRLQDKVGYAWHNMALLLDEMGLFQKAESAAREAIAIRTKLYGRDNPLTAISGAVLSHILMSENRFAEAAALSKTALAEETRVLGPRNLDTAYSQDCQGDVLLASGDAVGARRLFQSALDSRSALVGLDSANAAQSWLLLGKLDRAMGDVPAASQNLEHALEIRRRSFGADNTLTAAPETELSEAFTTQGSLDRAEKVARHAITTSKTNLPPGHYSIGAAESALGWAYLRDQRNAEALPLLEDAYSIAKREFGPDHPETAHAAIRLAAALASSGTRARVASLGGIAGPILDRSDDPTWNEDRNLLKSLRRKF